MCKYHVVCHDCPFEKMLDKVDEYTEMGAYFEARSHFVETDHDVEFAEVS